jgi:hypothetical protein
MPSARIASTRPTSNAVHLGPRSVSFVPASRSGQLLVAHLDAGVLDPPNQRVRVVDARLQPLDAGPHGDGGRGALSLASPAVWHGAQAPPARRSASRSDGLTTA